MPETPYIKGFPGKKLTSFGHKGSNGITHIEQKGN